MKKLPKFAFPKGLLNQIDSCTKGYLLITVDQNNRFETFQSLTDPLTTLGMANFIEIYADIIQRRVRDNAHGSDMGEV